VLLSQARGDSAIAGRAGFQIPCQIPTNRQPTAPGCQLSRCGFCDVTNAAMRARFALAALSSHEHTAARRIQGSVRSRQSGGGDDLRNGMTRVGSGVRWTHGEGGSSGADSACRRSAVVSTRGALVVTRRRPHLPPCGSASDVVLPADSLSGAQVPSGPRPAEPQAEDVRWRRRRFRPQPLAQLELFARGFAKLVPVSTAASRARLAASRRTGPAIGASLVAPWRTCEGTSVLGVAQTSSRRSEGRPCAAHSRRVGAVLPGRCASARRVEVDESTPGILEPSRAGPRYCGYAIC